MIHTEAWFSAGVPVRSSLSQDLAAALRHLETVLPLTADDYMNAITLLQRKGYKRGQWAATLVGERFIEKLHALRKDPGVDAYLHQYLSQAEMNVMPYLFGALSDLKPAGAYREMDHFFRTVFNPVLQGEPEDALRVIRKYVGSVSDEEGDA